MDKDRVSEILQEAEKERFEATRAIAEKYHLPLQEAIGDTSERFSPRSDFIHQLLMGTKPSTSSLDESDLEWANKLVGIRRTASASSISKMALNLIAEMKIVDQQIIQNTPELGQWMDDCSEYLNKNVGN